MISFSDDIDKLADSSGEKTGATLTKPDMPKDFTICAAYMVEAWTTDFEMAALIELNREDGKMWAVVNLFSGNTYTEFKVRLGLVNYIAHSERVWFPLSWSRVCLSLDTVTGNVRLVVNGEVLKDMVHKEALKEDEWRPAKLDMVLGYSPKSEFTGMISQLNMFSSPLSTARMVALTEAGGEECGAPGDYFSWEEEDWKLTSQARVEMVGELEAPCRKESEVTVYTAEFLHHSAATNPGKPSGCMEHCKKLGKGRSPPVRTFEEWDWLRREVRALTIDDPSVVGKLWLAATDDEVEGEWRDAYSPYHKLNTSVAWPWWSFRKDTSNGDTYNCLQWLTHKPDEASWKEHHCFSFDMACLKDVS